jgi:hypothetical protein
MMIIAAMRTVHPINKLCHVIPSRVDNEISRNQFNNH